MVKGWGVLWKVPSLNPNGEKTLPTKEKKKWKDPAVPPGYLMGHAVHKTQKLKYS